MFVFTSPAQRVLGLMLTLAGVAGAQAEPKACEIDESRPAQVSRAMLAVQLASSAQGEAATKQLAEAVKRLTENPERIANQVGRNFVLGKALVMWTLQPNVPVVTTRGAVGYATNQAAPVDLVLAIDSAFSAVEATNPECISETARWRGQKAWVDLVNLAIERMNAEDTDSATTLANRAILLNPHGPYGYVVLGNIKQRGPEAGEAFGLYKKAIEVAERDTTFDEIRQNTLLYLGNLAADSVEASADVAAKKPYAETATAAYNTLIEEKNSDLSGNARSGLCRVSIAMGDTASLRHTFREPLSTPASFSYSDLVTAGVCMAKAEMVPEATTLFQSAYDKNPYHRDVLSNLAIMLVRAEQHERAMPLINRLVTLDPNNPEALQLQVLAYAGIAKKATDARRGAARGGTPAPSTKAPGRGARGGAATSAPRLSAAASDSLFQIERAYTDSAVATNDKREKLAYRVSVTEFTVNDEKATVAGSVTNQGTETKPVTVRVDFIDVTGKVVSTQEASAGSPAPKSAARFSATVNPGTGITGFRYTRIE